MVLNIYLLLPDIIQLVTILIPGKTDPVSSDQVVTTEVCPRSRPEGRKLDSTLSLPPPPPIPK